MKKSVILSVLTFEEASQIKLFVYLDDSSEPLWGIFSPIGAKRYIRSLPARYRFDYTPVK